MGSCSAEFSSGSALRRVGLLAAIGLVLGLVVIGGGVASAATPPSSVPTVDSGSAVCSGSLGTLADDAQAIEVSCVLGPVEELAAAAAILGGLVTFALGVWIAREATS